MFPNIFLFKLDQPAQKREKDAALTLPGLLAAWAVTLSLLPLYSFALPGSKHVVLTLLSAG